MKKLAPLLAAAVAAIVAIAWTKRPITPPPVSGKWHPVDSEHTRR